MSTIEQKAAAWEEIAARGEEANAFLHGQSEYWGKNVWHAALAATPEPKEVE